MFNINAFLYFGVVCGALCNPANGQVNTSAGVSFENEATYQCDPGYVLSDQSSRVCNSDGNWNGTEPVCDPVGMYLKDSYTLEQPLFNGAVISCH